MSEHHNPEFAAEVDELAVKLIKAIESHNINAIAGLSTRIEEYWAFAAARLDRSALRCVDEKLLTVISSGSYYANNELTSQNPLVKRLTRLQALRSVSAHILGMDLVGAADEDRAYLAKHKYDSIIVELVHEQGIAQRKEILDRLKTHEDFLKANNPSQTCNNHLRRLCREGFLLRTVTGSYRLGVRGRSIAEKQKRSWLEGVELLMQKLREGAGQQVDTLVDILVAANLVKSHELPMAKEIIGNLKELQAINDVNIPVGTVESVTPLDGTPDKESAEQQFLGLITPAYLSGRASRAIPR